jgi:hypothetical protein
MLMLGCNVGEDDARCDLGTYPEQRGLPQITFAKIWKFKKP